jgi:alanine dehydrogenase
MNTVKKVVCKIFVLRERMKGEGRVALTPHECAELVKLGHKVYVERDAGVKSGYENIDYYNSGALVTSTDWFFPLLFLNCPNAIVLKVKQPLPEDDAWFKHMKNGVLFAYFHSTGEKDRRTIDILLKNNITAISYELIEKDGTYPLLVPMSEIAGRLAVEWGWNAAQKKNPYRHMVVCGAGTVGFSAIKKALEMGFSSIIVFEKDEAKELFLREHLTPQEMQRVKFFLPSHSQYGAVVKRELENTDLLVGAVLVPGGHAPTVVSEAQVMLMNKGSVIVDVAVDQGGCIWHPENETATTFEYEGKTFFRVPNMPGSVPKESTPVLAKAIFPYLLEVLHEDTEAGFKKNAGLRKGLLTHEGAVMNKKAAECWNEYYIDPDRIFGS